MIGGDDGCARFRRSRHFRDMNFFAAHIKTPGEVEITIEERPVPGNRNQGSAHQPPNCAGIKIGNKLLHVAFKIARLNQPPPEAPQGHVGKIKQAVKRHTPFFLQYLMVSFFRCVPDLAVERRRWDWIPGSVPARIRCGRNLRHSAL